MSEGSSCNSITALTIAKIAHIKKKIELALNVILIYEAHFRIINIPAIRLKTTIKTPKTDTVGARRKLPIIRRVKNPVVGIIGSLVKEKRITRDEIYIADEAFFTGTAAEVTPIRELDGRVIGNGAKGKITKELQKQYFDCVCGKLDEYNDWLSYIS